MLFVEDGGDVDGDEMLKKHLYIIRSLSCGKKLTIKRYRVRCHTANSVTNYIIEIVLDYVRKEN